VLAISGFSNYILVMFLGWVYIASVAGEEANKKEY
jgi:hypothetical protein